MDTILIANIINTLGALGLSIGHWKIAHCENNKMHQGFLYSALGAFLTVIGSYLLQSTPVVLLNSIWAIMSLQAAYNHKKQTQQYRPDPKWLHLAWLFIPVTYFLFSVDDLAYVCTAIYLYAYLCFSQHTLTRNFYLLWGVLGYLLLVPHLWTHFQFAVFANETLDAIVSILGLAKVCQLAFSTKRKANSQ
jgi:hypothetical protein